MRHWKAAALTLAGICLYLCMFATIAYNRVTNHTIMLQGFYQFADTSLKGVPASAYPDYAAAITDYLKDKRDDLNVTAGDGSPREQFSEKELTHMRDVRGIVRGLGAFRFISGGLALALVGLYWAQARKKESREQMARAILSGMASGAYILLGVVLALALWGVFNFTGLFITFHKVFFRNDLWLLNPNRDLLIMLMPTRFFIWYARDIVFHCWPALAVMLAAMGAGATIKQERCRRERDDELQ